MNRIDKNSNTLGQLTDELRRHNAWSREELLEYQQKCLREAMQYAVDRSSYYRDTVDHLVKANAPLAEFPVLTKRELIRNFDRIVTDRRLTLHDLEIHLDGADPGGVICDEYRIAATGGTTGERAVVVYDQLAWDTGISCALRDLSRNGGGPQLKTIGIGASSLSICPIASMRLFGRTNQTPQSSVWPCQSARSLPHSIAIGLMSSVRIPHISGC